MKRFFFLLFVIANCLLATAQTASSVLSQLTFEEPSKLYRVKGNHANIRKQPSPKAAKVEVKDRDYLVGGEIIDVLSDNSSWVKARIDGKVVYISKSVLTLAEQEPISFASHYNIPFWYVAPNFSLADGGIEYQCWAWRMGKIKGTSGLFLCQCQEWDGTQTLRLGKQVGNVLVFKYKIYIDGFHYGCNYQPYGKWSIDSEMQYERKVYSLLVDKNTIKRVRVDDDGNSEDYLDLTKITEPMVYALFKDVIEKNETDYLYLTSYSFDKKWPRIFD